VEKLELRIERVSGEVIEFELTPGVKIPAIQAGDKVRIVTPTGQSVHAEIHGNDVWIVADGQATQPIVFENMVLYLGDDQAELSLVDAATGTITVAALDDLLTSPSDTTLMPAEGAPPAPPPSPSGGSTTFQNSTDVERPAEARFDDPLQAILERPAVAAGQSTRGAPGAGGIDANPIPVEGPVVTPIVITLNGNVIDGYIVGATVFADADGDGIQDSGEAFATTGANGAFTLVGGSGPLVMTGGIDVATGEFFKGTLTAPAGSTVVTPLTTLVQSLVEAGQTAAAAEAAVKSAFGLGSDLDLTDFDPVKGVEDGVTGADAAMAAAIQIQNTVVQAASVLQGAGGSGVALGTATNAVYARLASALQTDSTSSPIDSAAKIQTLITSAADNTSLGLGASAKTQVSNAAASASTIIHDIVAAVDALGSSGSTLLTDLAKIAYVAQNGAAEALYDALDAVQGTGGNANLTTATNDYSAAGALNTAIGNAASEIGTVGTASDAGTDGDDVITGGAGNDTFDGGAGNDVISGGAGNDMLIGGAGNDTLSGDAGNDTLIGGAGNDTLNGGAGIDTAKFSGNFADYTVTAAGGGTDVTLTIAGTDGTDQVKTVEILKFNDLTVRIAGGGSEYTTLSAAMNAATAGERILLTGSTTFPTGTLTLAKKVSLQAAGSDPAVTIASDGALVVDGSLMSTVNALTISGIPGTTTVRFTDLGNIASITTASGQTLTLAAADLDGLTVTGAGSVSVAGGTVPDGDDLSGISSTISVPSGTLTLSAAQADGLTVTGAGAIAVTALGSAAVDLSDITVTGAKTAAVPASATLAAGTDLGDFALSVAAGQTLTLSAAQADGATIGGAGNVTVTAVTAATDLSGVDPTGTLTAVVTGTVDGSAAADLGTVDVYQVTGALTLTAAQASGLGITGTGPVTISGLAAATDLSDVATSGTVTATVAATLDVSANGNLGPVDVFTITSGTLTLTAAQADGATITGGAVVIAGNVTASADLTDVASPLGFGADGTIDVGTGATLTLTVAQAAGKTITGTGTGTGRVLVDGDVTADANLAGISAMVDFTGNTVAVSAGQTLTLTAAQAGDTAITGAGTVALSGNATGVDLSAIEADLTVPADATLTLTTAQLSGLDTDARPIAGDGTVALSGNATSLGTLSTYVTADLSVAASQTLTLSAAQADGLDLTGAGNATITGLGTTAVDLSGIAVSGTAKVTVTGNQTLHADTDLGNVTLEIAAGQTVSMTAAQASGVTITGGGTLVITSGTLDDAADFANWGVASIDLRGATLDFDAGAGSGDLVLPNTSEFHLTYTQANTLDSIQGTTGTNTIIIDVSAATGGVTYTANEATIDVNIQTGDGNDRVVFDFGAQAGNTINLSATSVINLGAGTGDTLESSNGTVDISAVPVANISGVENIEINSTIAMSASQFESALLSDLEGAGDLQITVDAAFFSGTPKTLDLTGLDFEPGGSKPPTVQINADGYPNVADDGTTVVLSGHATLPNLTISLPTDGASEVPVIVLLQTGLNSFTTPGALGGFDDSRVVYQATTTVFNADQFTDLVDAIANPGSAPVGLLGTTPGIVDVISLSGPIILDSDSALNISGLDVDILYNGYSIEVTSGDTLTLTAEQADGGTITGAGSVVVSGIAAVSGSLDLSGITAANATVEISGVLDLDPTSMWNLGDLSLTTLSGATLTLTAAQADGMTIVGAGAVEITGLGSDPVDLSGITPSGGVTARVSVDLALSGLTDLGDLALTLDDGVTLTLTRAQLHERSIAVDDGDAATLRFGGDATATDLSDIGADVAFEVAAGRTLTLTAAQADGRAIEGAGNLVVTGLTAGIDLSGIATTGTVTATVTASADLGGVDLDAADILQVAAGQTLTLATGQIDGLAINGAGAVTVTGLGSAAVDLSAITVSGAKTALVSDSAELNAATKLGGFALSVAEDATLQLTAAQANGLTITGDGSVVVTDLGLAAADLSTIAAAASATVSGAVTLPVATDLGDVVVAVASGGVLTLAAGQADGAAIGGAGAVIVTGLAAATDLSGVDPAGTLTATVAQTVDISDNANLGTVEAFQVADGKTLTLSAAQADGTPITGAGKVAVTDLGGAAVDLSKVAVGGSRTIDVTADTTLHADTNLDAFSVTVAAGFELTLTAAQAAGKAIGGAGDVTVTGLGAATVDLSTITATGDLVAHVGGSATLAAGTKLGGFDVAVDAGTLTLTAAQADGLAVSGAGAVTVTNLGLTAVDLSGVTVDGAKSLIVESSLTLASGTDLGDFAVAVAAGQTLQLTAAQTAGIAIGGAGNVTVTGLAADTDLSDVDPAGTLTARVALSADISGNADLGTVEAFAVASGQTLTLAAAQADGTAISGAGNVTVKGLSATTDLSDLAATGTVIATVTANADITANDTLGVVDEFQVTGATLTLTAAQADGQAVTGAGNVTITGLGTAAVDLSAIAATGTVTAAIVGSIELAAATDLGGVTITVAAGNTLTLSAAQADGLTITGNGAVVITGDVAGIDLDNIADTLTVTLPSTDEIFTVDGTAELTVAEANAYDEITGAGTLALSGNASTLDDLLDKIGPDIALAVTAGKSLILSAAQAHDLSVAGTGTVVVTGEFEDGDYSGITANLDLSGATLSGTTTFPEIGADRTLTLTAGQVDATSIDVDADGKVVVDVRFDPLSSTNDALPAFDIAGITAAGSNNPADVWDVVDVASGAIADKFKLFWVSADQKYYENWPTADFDANTVFVELGNLYVDYLLDGGAPILDVVQTKVGGVPNFDGRQQSLHENLLNNLSNGAIAGRFGSDPANDPRSDAAKDFGTRPSHDGTINTGTGLYSSAAALAAVIGWDLAHGYDYTADLAGPYAVLDGDNTFTGTVTDNFFYAGAGDDALNGGAGEDTLYGAAGDDTLTGGAGADTLDGGADIDTASYAASTAGVTVDLSSEGAQSGGDAEGDTLSGIENVTGSAHDDALTGDAGDNVLEGGAGDDTLSGGAGDDTLIGGSGTDTAVYDTVLAAGDIAYDSGTGQWVVSAGDEGTDRLSGIEAIDHGEGRILLVGGGSEYATIQAAIDAAAEGDTIVIAPGTYAENLTIATDGIKLVGLDGTVIAGTITGNPALTEGVDLDVWLETATTYSGTDGITIAADNVVLEGLTLSGFKNAILLGTTDGTTIKDVDITQSITGVTNGYPVTNGDGPTVTNLTIEGGSITHGYQGITINASKKDADGEGDGTTFVGTGAFEDVTITGLSFEHLNEKGVYLEQAQDLLITGVTLTDVGEYGRNTPFGGNGVWGNGLELNVKYGDYSNVTITNFTLTDVGHSYGADGIADPTGAAIAIKARDDGTDYGNPPATLTGVTVSNGTINGTYNGIKFTDAGASDVTVENVTVTNADNSPYFNSSPIPVTLVLTDGADVFDGSASSVAGAAGFIVQGGAGDDTVTGGAGIDTLVGGAGDDTLDGGDGADAAVFSGDLADYDMTGLVVTDGVISGTIAGGTDGTDTLANVEALKFADGFHVLPGMSIQAAIDAAQDGDTIYVAAGTYDIGETIVIDKSITLVGAQAGVDPRTAAGLRTAGSEGESVIRGAGDPPTLDTLIRIAADNVTIDGFDIGHGTGDLVESDVAIANPLIRNSFVHDSTGDEGIQLRQSSNALIENNHVYGTAGDGINLADSTGGTIRSNQVHDIASPDAAIYVYGSTDTTIQGNIVHNSTSNDGIKLGAKGGTDAANPGGSIIDNVVSDTAQDGIAVYMSDVAISGNDVSGSGSENGAIYIGFTVNGITITDNTIHDNGTDGAPITYAIRLGKGGHEPTDVTIEGNTFERNEAQVFDNSGLVDLEAVLLDNTFVDGAGALVVGGNVIWASYADAAAAATGDVTIVVANEFGIAKYDAQIAHAAPEIGGGTDGFHPGSGNTDVNFTITDNPAAGIEAALRAKLRYNGDLDPDGSTYFAEAGTTTSGSGVVGAQWNIDYSVISYGANADIGNFDVKISVSFVDLQGNQTQVLADFDIDQFEALVGERYYDGAANGTEGLQNSQNLMWWAGEDFDPNAVGSYELTLTVTDIASNAIVAQTQTTVKTADIIVGPTGDPDHDVNHHTVNQAVAAAQDGDVILVKNGVVDADTALVLNKAVTIMGADASLASEGAVYLDGDVLRIDMGRLPASYETVDLSGLTGVTQIAFTNLGDLTDIITADGQTITLDGGQIDAISQADGTLTIAGGAAIDVINAELTIPEDGSAPGVKNLLALEFAGLDGAKSLIPDNLTVDGSNTDAFTAFWIQLDQAYVGSGDYYDQEINTSFAYLGNDYAAYLQAGGEALLDIVKVPASRAQSLHDNLLGNLGDGAINSRFISKGHDDPRTEAGQDFGTRPYHEGTVVDGEYSNPAAVSSVIGWDIAHGVAYPDSLPAPYAVLDDANTLTGGSGADYVYGGAGDDTITGGAGGDMAAYFGEKGDYTFADDGNDHIVVTDANAADGDAGSDTLSGVETLAFADGGRVLIVGADSAYTTIQAAITAAAAGDTIVIAEGTYAESLTLSKAITLQAAEGADVVIDPANGNGLTINGELNGGDVTLVGITFAGGVSGIQMAANANVGTLTLDDVMMSDNSAYGLRTNAGSLAGLVVTDSTFRNDLTGVSTENGSAHMKLYGFSGDAAFTNVTLSGSAPTTGQNNRLDYGIELTGISNAGLDAGGVSPGMGAVVFTNVTVDGAFHKNAVAVYNYGQIGGLDIASLDLSGAETNWGPLFNVDGVEEGTVDARAYNIAYPDTAAIVAELQGEVHQQAEVATTIHGTDANERLMGKDGDDMLYGGAGDDELFGADKPGNDLEDETSNDTLYGEAGDDLLVGGLGADHLDGGEGVDTASYARSEAGVTVDLAAGTGVGGDAQGDTLTGIETVIGSAHDDTFTGDANDNTFDGGAGDDTVVYEAARADLAFGVDANGNLTVTSEAGGTDALKSIETVSFGDGSASILYVGADGAYATIQAAVDAASAGDIIVVAPGTYTPFGTAFGGAADVTILGAEGATIDATNDVGLPARIVDLRADGTTFRGFTIEGPGGLAEAGVHVGISISGQGVTVEDNTISNILTGIQTNTAYPAGNNVITGNDILAEYGISLQNTDNTVSGNMVAASVEGLGILPGANHLTGNTFTIEAGGDALGLYNGAAASDLSLSKNTVTVGEGTNLQDAIALAGTDGTVNVGAGTYAEAITVTQEGLTIAALDADDKPVITGTGKRADIAADDVTLENIVFNLAGDTTTDGILVINRGGSWPVNPGDLTDDPGYTIEYSGITLSGVEFIGGNRAVYATAEDLTIEDSTFSGQSEDAIYLNAVAGTTTIADNAFSGDPGTRKAILFENFSSEDPVVSGTIVITGNTLDGKSNFVVYNQWQYGAGPEVVEIDSLTIADNTISGTSGTPISIYDPREYVPEFEEAHFDGKFGDISITGNTATLSDGSILELPTILDPDIQLATRNVDLDGNTIKGTEGVDTLIGTEGDDTLIGNDGDDTVVFSGDRSDYTLTVSVDEDGAVSGTVEGPDGTDTLSGFQVLKFADGFYVMDGMSIQAAIDAASEGDTIHVGPGTYTPETVAYTSLAYSGGASQANQQILVDKALTIVGEPGARIEVALPESPALADRTMAFTVAANGVTVSGFEIVGPLTDIAYTTTDFATQGYIYGVFVDKNVQDLTLSDNTIYDVRTGVTFEGGLGNTATVTGNDIFNTRGAFLVRSDGIDLSDNTFGTVGNEWDVTFLAGTPADYFADPLADPAAYGDAMMALSAANNDMTVLDRLYGEGGILTQEYAVSDPDLSAQLAEIANRSHVDVLLGASNEPDAAVGESRGNGFGNPRLPMGTLQDAVDVVVKGGVVSLHDGDYGGEGIDGVVTITTEGLTLTGGAGAENVTVQLGGGVMNVSLLGEAGYQAFGNELDNILSGGEGADLLFGGDGNDTLAGGGGDDVFAFMADDSGIDTVTDFEEGDALDFSDILSDANDLIFEDHAESGGTQISYEGEAIAIVQSVTPDSLTVDDSGNVVLTPPA